jgi:hypothetical protein
MKESNLPFKRLSATRLPLFSIYLGLFTLASACNSRKPTADVSTESPNLERPLVSVANPDKDTWIRLRSAAEPVGPLRLSAKSCVERKFLYSAQLNVLGQSYDMVFEEEAGQLSLVTIEDSETKLVGLDVPQELDDAICASQTSSAIDSKAEDGFALDEKHHAQLQNTILAAMKKVAPDCKTIVFGADSAQCRLEAMEPGIAIDATEDFQKVMIRKWSRQPYILARRSGVISSLAKVASVPANDEAFSKFCRVLQFSIPEELPVAMTSVRWQKALCSEHASVRKEAALYGLAKGIQELALLRELYESTSMVGSLSVKIPAGLIPGRAPDVARQPLRITIAPDENVAKRIMDEAKKYLGRPEIEGVPKRLVRAKRHGKHGRSVDVAATAVPAGVPAANATEKSDMCWHPLFSESWNLLQIVDGMKLTGKGFNLDCGFIYERAVVAGSELASLSKYLIQSLSSETEFVMDNGQTKLLRLPEGIYQYTVHVLPANPLDAEEVDDKNVPKTTGELGWGSSHKHSIKVW